MRIRFETTLDDLIAFNRFHIENSPAMRRQRMQYALLVPGILAFAGLIGLAVLSATAKDDPFAIVFVASLAGLFGVATSIGWFFFARWRWMAQVMRNVRKLYSEGSNRIALGWREMQLVGNRLNLQTEFVDNSIDLRAIDKIVGNEDYTFVYISSNQAYLIPMNLYPEEEYRQFVAELREAWENRDEMPPLPPNRQRDERIMEQPR